MGTEQVIERASDTLAVRRVFGEPIERDGVTVIPAAVISGGGGGGESEKTQGGNGGGFGLTARPLGAFVIEGGHVRWRPAVNINRVIAGAQIVMGLALLTLRAALRLRAASARPRIPLLRAVLAR